MNRNRVAVRIALLLVLCVFLSVAPALADPIVVGVPVSGPTTPLDPVATAMIDADGTINFFIPLQASPSGTFGVGGVGMSSDTAAGPRSDGFLDMWLSFSPVNVGNGILTLNFNDLDLFGANDPAGFLESIEIFDSSGNTVALIQNATDPGVVSFDATNQTIAIALNVASDPFFVRLHFGSSLPSGTWTNTVEQLKATVQVPEPSTLLLLSSALLFLILWRARAKLTSTY